MRATYINPLKIQPSYQLKGEQAHHLLNVARVEINEEILLLDGAGLMVKTQVSEISKRELTLQTLEHEEVSRKYNMDLALGIPKKEALELSLKQAVELGFRKIYLIRSTYSQNRIPDIERIKSLLISALEQSNGAFFPEIIQTEWNGIRFEDYENALMLDSQSKSLNPKKAHDKFAANLLIVGPEGGFSQQEMTFLHVLPNISVLNLPTPILRTPTAVATGAGIILGSLLD